jgi:hypothetical protein
MGIGGALLTGGIALGIVALTNVMKTRGTEVVESTVELPGSPVGPPSACDPPVAAADVPVDLRISRVPDAEQVGTTDARGQLTIDLRRHVPKRILERRDAAPTLSLRAGPAAPVELDVAPLLAPYDHAAWAAAGAVRCAAPSQPGDCEGVSQYLREFPDGRHADEAQRVLHVASSRLEELAAIAAEERRIETERQRALLEAREADAARRAEARHAEQRRRAVEAEARAAKAKQCRASCADACGGDAGCKRACVRERC